MLYAAAFLAGLLIGAGLALFGVVAWAHSTLDA